MVRSYSLVRRSTRYVNSSLYLEIAKSQIADVATNCCTDAFFSNVCELDLVFNFYKVYAILDEVFLAGEIEETSKQVILERLEYLERLD